MWPKIKIVFAWNGSALGADSIVDTIIKLSVSRVEVTATDCTVRTVVSGGRVRWGDPVQDVILCG